MTDTPSESPDSTDESEQTHRLDEADERTSLTVTGRVPDALTTTATNGTAAIAGGAIALISALRLVTRSRARAVLTGVVGAALIAIGRRQRQSADEGQPDFETYEDSEMKDTSDDAFAATESHDASQRLDSPFGEDDEDETQIGAAETDDIEDDQSHITFTDEGDEPRSKPSLEEDEADPRRETPEGGDDDADVEVDVSKTAIADEPAEATGPDPEQAQPAQTDDVEPDASPEEDSSHMAVDSAESSESNSDEDEDEDEDIDPQEEADEDAAEEHRP